MFHFLVCVICVFLHGTSGFFMDNPCDIDPAYAHGGIPQDRDVVTVEKVPSGCQNGTLDWNYPKGHLMLHFPNLNHMSTSICLRDWLGGDVFTISDVTNGQNRPLGQLSSDNDVCTAQTTASDVILKVDAPEEQRYMGGFTYRVVHA